MKSTLKTTPTFFVDKEDWVIELHSSLVDRNHKTGVKPREIGG